MQNRIRGVCALASSTLRRDPVGALENLPHLIELFHLPVQVRSVIDLTSNFVLSVLHKPVVDNTMAMQLAGTDSFGGDKRAFRDDRLVKSLENFGDNFQIDPAIISAVVGLTGLKYGVQGVDLQCFIPLAERFGNIDPEKLKTLLQILDMIHQNAPRSMLSKLTTSEPSKNASDASPSASSVGTSEVSHKISGDSSNASAANDSSASSTLSPDVANKLVNPNGGVDSAAVFSVLDKSGRGSIDYQTFQEGLKLMNIDVAEQKALRIFTSHASPEGQLSKSGFESAITRLQDSISARVLAYLGLSTAQLTKLFIILLVLVFLLLAFVFLGISGFASGGTFNTIINSLLPVMGTLGVGSQSAGDTKELGQRAEKLMRRVLNIFKKTL